MPDEISLQLTCHPAHLQSFGRCAGDNELWSQRRATKERALCTLKQHAECLRSAGPAPITALLAASLLSCPRAPTTLSPAQGSDTHSLPPSAGLVLLSPTPAFVFLLGGDLFFIPLDPKQIGGVSPTGKTTNLEAKTRRPPWRSAVSSQQGLPEHQIPSAEAGDLEANSPLTFSPGGFLYTGEGGADPSWW